MKQHPLILFSSDASGRQPPRSPLSKPFKSRLGGNRKTVNIIDLAEEALVAYQAGLVAGAEEARRYLTEEV
jgi:hypothetical protein